MSLYFVVVPFLAVLIVEAVVVPRGPHVPHATAFARLGGLVAGGLAAWAVVEHDRLGRGLLLAAPVVALGVLLGIVVGELLATAPAGPVRTAGLEVRRPLDYIPRALGTTVATALLALAAIAAFTTLTGTADDLGRAGRSLSMACGHGVTSSAGPWPGSFYSGPLAVVVGAGLVLAVAAQLLVTRRPQPQARRRGSGRAITAGVGILAGLPLAGVAAVAAAAITHQDCAPGGWNALVPVLGVVAVAGLVVTGWCAATLVRQ